MFFSAFLFSFVFPIAILTAPLEEGIAYQDSGVHWDATSDLPTIKLPYGTYRAASYNADADVYIFKNIRFAQNPIGDLRWAKPAAPLPESGIQNGSYGFACPNIMPKTGLNFFGSSNANPSTSIIDAGIGGIGALVLPSFSTGGEDCLFLDVYVGGKVLARTSSGSAEKVPVVNWIYGGAYLLGAKEWIRVYSGTHLIKLASGNMIWVAGNYRLGIYGWLAGKTMEKEGLPNTGLYDQRATLQWIQDYIHLFGGDKSQVSAWGESAGTSSILHHLVAFGGKQDPLFTKAAMLSPAFQPLGDRRPDGALEQTYQKILNIVGCQSKTIACIHLAPRGTFGVGASADGIWSRQFPAVELLKGNVWKGMESVIISSTEDEGSIFVDGHIRTDAQFDEFILQVLGPLAKDFGFVDQIKKFYPPIDTPGGKYQNVTARVMDFIRDMAFSCNNRYLSQAYKGKTWNLLYSQYPGWHGSDIIATFLRSDYNVFGMSFSLKPEFQAFAKTYQSYLVSHAMTGNPNKMSLKTATSQNIAAINWPKGVQFIGEDMVGVLQAENQTFRIGTNKVAPKSACEFLQEFESMVVDRVGLNPGGKLYNGQL